MRPAPAFALLTLLCGSLSATASYAQTPRWFRGDLHIHTQYSDGKDTVAQTVAMARRQRLDFVGLCDHGTLAQGQDPAAVSQPGLEVVVGYEWSGKTHLLIVGGSTVRPTLEAFPKPTWNAETQAVVDAARAEGAVVIMNHPTYTQFPWIFDTRRAHALEVWNSFWTIGDVGLKRISRKKVQARLDELGLSAVGHAAPPQILAAADASGFANNQAVAYWQELLARGERVAAVGGSDRHMTWLPGYPTTWVLAPSARRADVLEAIRRGRTFVSEGPDGPMVRFEADRDRDGRYESTVGDAVLAGRRAAFRVSIGGARGGLLRVFKRQRVLQQVRVTRDQFVHAFEDTPGRGDWYRVEVLVNLGTGLGADLLRLLRNPDLANASDLIRRWGVSLDLKANSPVVDLGAAVRRILNLDWPSFPRSMGALTSAIYVD
jgi:hypothetical protein